MGALDGMISRVRRKLEIVTSSATNTHQFVQKSSGYWSSASHEAFEEGYRAYKSDVDKGKEKLSKIRNELSILQNFIKRAEEERKREAMKNKSIR